MALFQKKEAGSGRNRGGWGKWVALAAVAVLAVLAARPILAARAQRNAAAQTVYTTELAQVRSITKSLSGSGTLKPANSYTVTTLVEGEVLEAPFGEGDTVEKDTVLYEVDNATALNNIQQSERSLEQTRLSLEQAQRALDQAQRNYESAQEKRYVKATGSGTVWSLAVKAGDSVTLGQVVAAIRDSAVMVLKVPFPTADAVTFFAGQSALVTLDGSFETLTGTVSEISGVDTVGAGNSITRTVTIEVANPGGLTTTQAATATVGGMGCAASGTFAYRSERTVTAPASGTVDTLLVAEGSAVTKDQTLLTLEGDVEDTVRAAYDSLQNAQGSLKSAQLSLENSQLSLERSQEQLDNYSITSPISGTIVDKQIKAGDTVSAGRTLCVIYDLSYLEMTLNVDELDISSIAVGQSVRITADAVEDREYEGLVTRVSVAGTTAGGTTSYPVTIRLEETDGLLPSMNVNAEIIIAQVADILSIPNGAVERGGLVLVTADSPSAAQAIDTEAPEGYAYVRVETGISDDDYVEIKSGLTPQDTVAYIPETAEFTDLFSMLQGRRNAAIGGGS